MDIKVLSWNINGITVNNQEKVESLKGIINDVQPDLILLQEVKCPDHIEGIKRLCNCCPEIEEEYNIIINSTKGYSGTATLIHKDFVTVSNTFLQMKVSEEFENYNNNRIICSYNESLNLAIINVYVPNAGAGLVRMDFKKQWMNKFKDLLVEFSKQNTKLIIMGDMNVIPTKNDMKNYDVNHNVAAGVTDIESELYSRLLGMTNLRDVAIELNKRQEYTFFGRFPVRNIKNNSGWRLDHCWVSPGIKILNYQTFKNYLGSDHIPFSVDLSI